MPIYEYACSHCGHQLDAMQSMKDAPLTLCPACQTEALQKQISAAGFRLSGAGWYETDFKTGAKKNLKETPASSASSPSTHPKSAE